jgi:hypothetical protein
MDALLKESVDTGKSGLVAMYELRCSPYPKTFDTASKAKCRDAVNYSEIDRFGVGPLFPGNFAKRHFKHLGCHGSVDVLVFGKGLEKGFVL